MFVFNIRKKSIIIFLVFLMALVPLASIIILIKNNKAVPEPEKTKEGPSPYGEFLSWEEVDKLFPKYSKAVVIDFETGLQFRVQRRAGKYHADVQPLTADDTAVMKMIYNGKWSWKRKAIIIQLDNGRRIAASMNGKPHGNGAIRGNNFNGHFCIHVRDSKTHGLREINIAHQIMVWKAANKVEEQLLSLGPKEVIDVFFTAIDQSENDIAWKVIDNESKCDTLLLEGLKNIKSIKLNEITDKYQNSFDIDVLVIYADSNKEYRKKISINMIKTKNLGWKIDSQTMLPLPEY